MKSLFITHALILTGLLIPVFFGLYWLSGMLAIPFIILLGCEYIFHRTPAMLFTCRLVLALVYVLICKLFVFDIFQVNSGSMEGTILKGDVLLVNKLAYGPISVQPEDISWIKLFYKGQHKDVVDRKHGYEKIRRNDVFIYELFPGYFVVKRCVGLPQDTVRIDNDSAYINNQLSGFPRHGYQQYRERFRDRSGVKKAVSMISESAIDSVNIDSNVIIANIAISQLSGDAIEVERLPNKLLQGKTPYFQPGVWTINNMGPLIVPDGHYFMMGDNRPYSEDSRYLGFIPEQHIVGKTVLVLYSYGDNGFIWNRLFKKVL